MSGRAKGTPADPAAEARETARELNGMLKDARAVIRELRAARAEMGETVDTMLVDHVNQQMEQVNAHVKASEMQIVTSIQETGKAILQQQAELLGASTGEELMKLMANEFTRQMYEDSFIKAVGEYVRAKLALVYVSKNGSGK